MLSIRRIGQVMRNDLRRKTRLYGLILGSVFVLVLFNFFRNPGILIDTVNNTTGINLRDSFLLPMGSITQKFHLNWFPRALLLSGFMVTSISFLEYTEKSSRIFHLVLPATRLEKWMAKMIFNAIVFPLSFVLIYQLFSYLLNSWASDMGQTLVHLDLRDPYIWKYVGIYLMSHCIVFCGAAWFRNYSFFKTIVACGTIYLAAVFIFQIVIRIIIPDIAVAETPQALLPNLSLDPGLATSRYVYGGSWNSFVLGIFGPFAGLIQMVLLVVLPLVLSYLKFAEMEA